MDCNEYKVQNTYSSEMIMDIPLHPDKGKQAFKHNFFIKATSGDSNAYFI